MNRTFLRWLARGAVALVIAGAASAPHAQPPAGGGEAGVESDPAIGAALAGQPAPTAGPDSATVEEGFLAHTADGGGAPTLLYFRVGRDGALTVREGLDPQGPRVTMPAQVARLVVERLNAAFPHDPDRLERVGLTLKDGELWVRWVRRVDLVTLLGLGGLGLGAGAWVWGRRERGERRRIAASHARLAAGQEVERRRLARELHDGPLQDLHGVRMRLGAHSLGSSSAGSSSTPRDEALREAGAASGGGPPAWPTEDLTEDLIEDLAVVITELRAICADLHPPALTPFGLAAALRAHVDRFQRRHPHLDCELDLDDHAFDAPGHDAPALEGAKLLSEGAELALFRVCQEALSNVVRHAGASHVGVSLRVGDDEAVLRVWDDGRGFVAGTEETTGSGGTSDLAGGGGYGLVNMGARAEAVGADLRLDSSPGRGTTVRVSVPFAAREAPIRGRRSADD